MSAIRFSHLNLRDWHLYEILLVCKPENDWKFMSLHVIVKVFLWRFVREAFFRTWLYQWRHKYTNHLIKFYLFLLSSSTKFKILNLRVTLSTTNSKIFLIFCVAFQFYGSFIFWWKYYRVLYYLSMTSLEHRSYMNILSSVIVFKVSNNVCMKIFCLLSPQSRKLTSWQEN